MLSCVEETSKRDWLYQVSVSVYPKSNCTGNFLKFDDSFCPISILLSCKLFGILFMKLLESVFSPIILDFKENKPNCLSSEIISNQHRGRYHIPAVQKFLGKISCGSKLSIIFVQHLIQAFFH